MRVIVSNDDLNQEQKYDITFKVGTEAFERQVYFYEEVDQSECEGRLS